MARYGANASALPASYPDPMLCDASRPACAELPTTSPAGVCGHRARGVASYPHADLGGSPALRPRASAWRGARCALAVGVACLPALAGAQAITWNGTAAVSSQLVDRGLAITPDTPVLQGAVSMSTASGWSAGLTASAEARSPGKVVEALAQGSRAWALSDDWQMQGRLLYYDYPSNSRLHAFDRAEANLGWIYRDVLSFGLAAIRVTGGSDHALRGAADLDLRWPLPWRLALTAGLGYAQSLPSPYRHRWQRYYANLDAGPYGYGQLGLAWNRGGWRAELDRVMTDPASRHQAGVPGASSWVATISRTW